MLSTYTFIFNRKKQPLKRGETALIQLRVTIHRKSSFYSTGIYIEKKYWKGEDRNWVVGLTDSIEYNNLLESIIQKVRSAEMKALANDKELSKELVNSIIKGKNTNSFVDFIKAESEKRKDISEGTKRHVNTVAKKLEDYGIINYSDLTLENIKGIDSYFRQKEHKDSTIDKFHSQMIAYINRAIQLDLFKIEKNPYLKFKRKRPKYVDRKYLTIEELEKIENKEMSIDRLRVVKDLFLFCCYTGLSFSDLDCLKPSNIIEENGNLLIRTFRQKTDERSTIFLFEKARGLLQKYADKRKGFCFPMITNQRMNAYLKEVAAISEVEKNLTFHMARHNAFSYELEMNWLRK